MTSMVANKGGITDRHGLFARWWWWRGIQFVRMLRECLCAVVVWAWSHILETHNFASLTCIDLQI